MGIQGDNGTYEMWVPISDTIRLLDLFESDLINVHLGLRMEVTAIQRMAHRNNLKSRIAQHLMRFIFFL